jgi:hypothetical protein
MIGRLYELHPGFIVVPFQYTASGFYCVVVFNRSPDHGAYPVGGYAICVDFAALDAARVVDIQPEITEDT